MGKSDMHEKHENCLTTAYCQLQQKPPISPWHMRAVPRRPPWGGGVNSTCAELPVNYKLSNVQLACQAAFTSPLSAVRVKHKLRTVQPQRTDTARAEHETTPFGAMLHTVLHDTKHRQLAAPAMLMIHH